MYVSHGTRTMFPRGKRTATNCAAVTNATSGRWRVAGGARCVPARHAAGSDRAEADLALLLGADLDIADRAAGDDHLAATGVGELERVAAQGLRHGGRNGVSALSRLDRDLAREVLHTDGDVHVYSSSVGDCAACPLVREPGQTILVTRHDRRPAVSP